MKRKIIQIEESLCNGCGQCVTACAEGAIKIIHGKAKLVSDKYCDGLGNCMGYCPTGALKIIEREAENFDETVNLPRETTAQTQSACHCPNSQPKVLKEKQRQGFLNYWPIQISLVPENANFFSQADLLIASDCTAFADPSFHERIQNKVVLIGCPKLDDAEFYVEKLAAIFKLHEINSVRVVRMSVPCCQGIVNITRQAMQKAAKNIPFYEEIIDQ